jgi:aminoglycoside 3-N-acetyltransferase
MVAVGARAEWLCSNHPMNYGYGPGTPLAKIYQAGGKVLLLGSHFDHVTILHYAEHCARLPNKRVITRTDRILNNGTLSEVSIEEFDTSELVCAGMPQNYFELIVRAFMENGSIGQGQVGGASSFLLPAHALVDFAVKKMEAEFGS